MLGIHLEGPFLDVQRKGAHLARYIREITAADVETIVAADCGAILVTLAPNRVPTQWIRDLAARGVLLEDGAGGTRWKGIGFTGLKAKAQIGGMCPRCVPK